MSEPTYFGPCAECGLSHGGWEPCSDDLNANARIAKMRQIIERVSARGNIVDALDVADLAAVLLLADDRARR